MPLISTLTLKSPFATLCVASITLRIGFSAFLLRNAESAVPSKIQRQKSAINLKRGLPLFPPGSCAGRPGREKMPRSRNHRFAPANRCFIHIILEI